MSSFNANINSQAFNIATENELAVVLSHYSTDFVFSVITDNMRKRFNGISITALPNVVAAWEQNFKAILSMYGQDNAPEVYTVRDATYREIINAICNEFALNFTIDENVDLYSAAYHLYDLFVCNFSNSMITFFANYIYRERDAIYDALNMSELKKNKDSSSAYGRKVFKDNKIGMINANIDMVISYICGMDFPFYNIIESIYGSGSELVPFFVSIVSANKEFFEKAYVSLVSYDGIRPEIITGIRFKLQELCMANMSIDTSNIPGKHIKEEETT